ncbi:MAG: nucleotidyltransferase domain-containing protein [Lachnospiraceae bacterium]
MCTQSQLDTVVKEISEIYRSVYGEELVRVILYGSYDRGDFSEDSDLDIVALVNGDRVKLQEQLKIVWDRTCDLELEYEMVLSPAVIPYEEFEKYREDLPYYRNIANEGVNVVA